jgi:hypothetical protein
MCSHHRGLQAQSTDIGQDSTVRHDDNQSNQRAHSGKKAMNTSSRHKCQHHRDHGTNSHTSPDEPMVHTPESQIDGCAGSGNSKLEHNPIMTSKYNIAGGY